MMVMVTVQHLVSRRHGRRLGTLAVRHAAYRCGGTTGGLNGRARACTTATTIRKTVARRTLETRYYRSVFVFSEILPGTALFTYTLTHTHTLVHA